MKWKRKAAITAFRNYGLPFSDMIGFYPLVENVLYI